MNDIELQCWNERRPKGIDITRDRIEFQYAIIKRRSLAESYNDAWVSAMIYAGGRQFYLHDLTENRFMMERVDLDNLVHVSYLIREPIRVGNGHRTVLTHEKQEDSNYMGIFRCLGGAVIVHEDSLIYGSSINDGGIEYWQNLRYGPSFVWISDRQIIKAICYYHHDRIVPSKSTSEVEGYTPEGRWENTQTEYLAREQYRDPMI